MPIRAVLFDVGGPLDTELEHERLIDRAIAEAVAAQGYPADPARLAEASEWAGTVFAPNAYAAMCWRLCNGDAAAANAAMAALEASSAARSAERGGIELRPGMASLVERLAGAGLKLGLAANQPARVVAQLDAFGIGQYFAHREVSGHHGYRKPDVRLFLRACGDLGAEPTECLMVGDRIDNDIAPARLLGMRTILFRTGRHIAQQPRSAGEVPDAEVRSVAELEAAIEQLIGVALG